MSADNLFQIILFQINLQKLVVTATNLDLFSSNYKKQMFVMDIKTQVRINDSLVWDKLCQSEGHELEEILEKMSDNDKMLLFSVCKKMCNRLGAS